MATVTNVNRTYESYDYRIGTTTHNWSVSQGDALYAVGQAFPITYLPEVATFSRPTVDRARATAEAAGNRSFTRKVVLGVFAFFAISAFACDFNLRRLRKRGRAELTDPHAYRMRLAFAGAMLAPFLILIFGWHGKDALQRGESLWPVVLGALLGLSILGGTAFYILRYGQALRDVMSALGSVR